MITGKKLQLRIISENIFATFYSVENAFPLKNEFDWWNYFFKTIWYFFFLYIYEIKYLWAYMLYLFTFDEKLTKHEANVYVHTFTRVLCTRRKRTESQRRRWSRETGGRQIELWKFGKLVLLVTHLPKIILIWARHTA